MHLVGGWKRNIGIQVLWDLMTVARQAGETVASALKPSHIDELTEEKLLEKWMKKDADRLWESVVRYVYRKRGLKV